MRQHAVVIAVVIAICSMASAVAPGTPGPDKKAAKVGDLSGGGAALQCETDLWCDVHGKCDASDKTGTCVKVPDVCPEDVRPVCACRGASYDNDCKRQKARAQLDHDGACDKKKDEQPQEPK